MKTFYALLVAASLMSGMALIGCETSHTETDKSTLTGGEKHEETTTTHNPVTGTDTTTHEEQKTNP